ncbi:MAG TPA: DNA-3-methyladenine glycosylase 2 family protein [Acidimicrobiia bacterium]|nr:DNA-3-methyladenine glycosylase 2 family protein [Acidimicrobiia bacterium]
MTTQAIIRRDARALVAADPRLDPGGPMMIETLDGGFPGMIHLILGQQVSIEAADAMYARLKRLGPVTPEFLLALDDETLRSCGFTRMKTRYARTLADAVLGGLDLDGVAALDSTAAVTELVALPGIGRWTAECFLLFSAGHRDVFPAADLALRIGWQEIAGLTITPSEAELRAHAVGWSPRRSAAAHLIWHRYLRIRGRR